MKTFLKFKTIFLLLMFMYTNSNAQYTQSVKGIVTDMYTNAPLIGAQVIIPMGEEVYAALTDEDGRFKLENIPVGRHDVSIQYIGYAPGLIKNVYVFSGKEVWLEIELEETVTELEDVIIQAYSKDETINEMAQVSARMFSKEETERYAGSFGDPSRMAASYAGILTLGTQSNDIVIRGNSPNGMLWRMEGMQIPNPNHFGDMSGTGGTVSMLNNNVLSNSDFYSGAFPAEYGNALSGVFDLNLRTGNADKREYLAQIGFNGFELGAEGPIHKGSNASYLANYRYSTLGVFDLMGINIGVFAIPKYQDLSYNINFSKTKIGSFTLFGLGGINEIAHIDDNEETGEYGSIDTKTYMGFTGLKHTIRLGKTSNLTTKAAISGTYNTGFFENKEFDELTYFSKNDQYEYSFELKSEFKSRINQKNIIQVGIDAIGYDINYEDSAYVEEAGIFVKPLEIEGKLYVLQSYAQWKHRFTDDFSAVLGVNYQYTDVSEEHSFEPRASISRTFGKKHSVSFGFGMHSKLQPKFIYFRRELSDTINQLYVQPNLDLRSTKSRHYVLSYNYAFKKDHRLKIETYYQDMYDIPVEKEASYMSMLNYGTGFSEYEFTNLENTGTGYNYGAEFTLEKFFSNQFYYLFTASVFESKYKGSDGILRNTRFSTNIIANALGGYEWTVGKQNIFSIDVRVMWSGGERKLPLDYEASEIAERAVYDIENAYKEQFDDYFKADIKLSYKINKKNTHTLSIDIMNVTNRHNHYLAFYNKDLNDYEEVSQLGLLPTFLWRWNF
jgi:hypothetical protein